MSARQILVVAQITPPSKLSAARRIAGLTKYLARRGHEVTVLTSMVSGDGPVPGAAHTVRTRDLMVSPLNWRRGNFAAISGDSDTSYDPTPSAAASVLVPDLEVVGWVPFALSRMQSLRRERRFDCVITSSPPQSGHLVGLALKRTGMPWVADFRDGWTFEPTRSPFPTYAQRALDKWMESKVADKADVLVGVTEPITADLQARYGGLTRTVTNGFDPEEAVADEGSWSPPLSSDRYSLVYTGSLGFGGNSPEVFFDAMRLMKGSHPGLAERIEVILAGPTTAREQAAASGLEGSVRSIGFLPREKVLALQRRADCLVLFTGDDRPSVATGKLYEYLASGRPIIVVGNKSAAATIVESQGAGVAVPSEVPASIRDALVDAVSGTLVATGGPASVNRYSYPEVAGLMEEAVELAISSAK